MRNESKELKLKKKCQKDYPEFADTVDGMTPLGLERKLFEYAKYREETLLAKDKDEALIAAKEVAKELAAPYNDTIKALKTKMAYLNLLLAEKGGTVDQAANG